MQLHLLLLLGATGYVPSATRFHWPTRTARARPAESLAANLKAVVVGAGPAGLASAWVLAERGFDVTVLERRAEYAISTQTRDWRWWLYYSRFSYSNLGLVRPSPYESQKAYLYLVDGRGQRFTDMAGLTGKLASPELSVSSLNYTVTRIMPDGERVVAVPPILEPMDPVLGRPSYWIPRAALLGLLAGALPPSVRTEYGSNVHELRSMGPQDGAGDDGGGLEIDATLADGTPLRLEADLLIGADGLQSVVREKCVEWSGDAAGFTPVSLPSPSSGLAYKMLRLPARFRLSSDNASDTAEGRQAYSVRPADDAPLGKVRLGLLPVADPNFPRTANVILPPNHPVWALKTAEAVREWLRATFPSLPIDEIVDDAEAEAFAAGDPGTFPEPCYSPRQQLLLPSGAGVCLVGDSIHAFPPDIGQGVNAALSSVMHLAHALDEASASMTDDESPALPAAAPPPRKLLRHALPGYGRACAPEAEAVARIAQIGFPFQYPITRERNPLARPMWFANFLCRTFVLSKLAPRFFSPAAIVLVQRSHLSYTEVWAQAQSTTRKLRAIVALAVLAAAWRALQLLVMPIPV